MAYNVNTDLKRGDSIFLYLFDADSSGYTPIAFATSCALQVDGETIDTSNKMSGRWNSNLAGKNGYSISTDALFTRTTGHTSFDYLLGKMVAGGAIKWAMSEPAVDDNTFAFVSANTIANGEAIVTSLSLNAGNNEVASCSISMQGSGDLKTGAPSA